MAQKQRKKGKRVPQGTERAHSRAGSPHSSRPRGGEQRGPDGGRRGARARAWLFALAGLLILVAGVLAVTLIASHGAAGRRGPIVLISIDTLRADHLPAYGYGKIQTPAIDGLAKNGTLFENCYSHVPLTLPSHTSIFTGLLPSVHGVRDNLGFKVPSGIETLAAELKQAGYATGGAVSAYVLHSSTGISRGFDWYDDQFEPAGPDTPLTDVRRDGMETVERALAWLEERAKSPGGQAAKGDPIFLFVHLYEPHAPYTAPPRFQHAGRAPYDAAVMYSDEIVGTLFAGLRRLNLYDPSLVILLSDHGEGLREHGEETHGVFLYREDMHVPLIIKLPGNESGGRRVPVPVELIDIAPTIRDWAGLPPDPRLQGTSLIPAARGRELPGDRTVYAESFYGRLHFGWKELYSLTDSQYSFILAPRQELYDIRNDPGEVHNLLAQQGSATATNGPLPRQVALEYQKLHKELAGYVEQTRPAAPNPIDEEQLKKLQALGYMGSSAPESGKEAEAPDPKDRIGDLNLYQKAMRMKTIFMFPAVAKALETVLETSPRMIDAWDQLSDAYQHLGRLDKAVDALKQSLQIAPQRTAQRFELAGLLIQLKRFDEAREELRLAETQEPAQAETRLAYLEVIAARPEAARQAASGAAQGLPAAAPYVDGLLSYTTGEFSRAVSSFREAMKGLRGTSPDSLPYIRFYLGDALAREAQSTRGGAERAGLLQEAERDLQAELTREPTNAAVASSLCFVHALENDVQKVDKGLNDFARQNPSAHTYRLIAQLYRNMNLSDRAAQWSARARSAQ